jgi:hypothetical protein
MTKVLVFKKIKNDVAPAAGAKNDEPRTLRLVRVGDCRHGGGAELYGRVLGWTAHDAATSKFALNIFNARWRSSLRLMEPPLGRRGLAAQGEESATAAARPPCLRRQGSYEEKTLDGGRRSKD